MIRVVAVMAASLVLAVWCAPAGALDFGPQQIIQAGSTDLDVGTYSVPSLVDWDNDGLDDLLVGQREDGKVRLYLNTGSADVPAYDSFSYIQSGGADLSVYGAGCQGSFPRALDWNNDGRKDLLVGDANGMVSLFVNTGTDAQPAFVAGQFLTVGPAGSKSFLDVGIRATLDVADWNNDGRKDLICGDLDGWLSVFLNEGTDASPDFLAETLVFDAGSRTSPVVRDLTGDGCKDVLLGNTEGEIRLYENTGTDAVPAFGDFLFVTSEGVCIDLSDDPRSRPWLGYWGGDGYLDMLVGDETGLVFLYEGLAVAGDCDRDADIDAADLATLGLNWAPGATDSNWAEGDFDGDGDVDSTDLAQLGMHWSPGGVAVPEPATAGLLVVAAVGFLRRR